VQVPFLEPGTPKAVPNLEPNAPSPAATASMPIGERIAAMAAEALGR